MSHSNRRNGHVAYRLDAPAIVRFRICAGAPAPRQRQTRREAGAQSLRASLGEAAGLPNGGGVATSALEDSTLDPRKEWCIFGGENLLQGSGGPRGWGQASNRKLTGKSQANAQIE